MYPKETIMTTRDFTAAPTSRVCFIPGCSTGCGQELAEAVLARGDRLVATARHLAQIQTLVQPYPGQARVRKYAENGKTGHTPIDTTCLLYREVYTVAPSACLTSSVVITAFARNRKFTRAAA